MDSLDMAIELLASVNKRQFLRKELAVALIEAAPHVARQEHAGKHEQDRIDAIEWLEKWTELIKWARSELGSYPD